MSKCDTCAVVYQTFLNGTIDRCYDCVAEYNRRRKAGDQSTDFEMMPFVREAVLRRRKEK